MKSHLVILSIMLASCLSVGCSTQEENKSERPKENVINETAKSSTPQVDAAAEYLKTGIRYFEGKEVRRNYLEALKHFRKSAGHNNPEAQYYIGKMYLDGLGVTTDNRVALEWFLKSANQGDPQGQTGVGAIYVHGFGVDQDSAEAMKWFKLAADQQLSKAFFHLGRMYENGLGVPKDFGEAIRWYSKAADKRFSMAGFRLSKMYETGSGVPIDKEEAQRWFDRATEHLKLEGDEHLDTDSMYERAERYENGVVIEGVVLIRKDLEEALKWYEMSANAGSKKAKKKAQELDFLLFGPRRGKICQTTPNAIMFKTPEALLGCFKPDSTENTDVIGIILKTGEGFDNKRQLQVIITSVSDSAVYSAVRELKEGARTFFVHNSHLKCPMSQTAE